MYRAMGRVLAAVVMFAAFGGSADAQPPPNVVRRNTPRVVGYEVVVPSNSQKGYYVPRVVPYPGGQPVHVSGYYRQNGSYLPPSFRSLPHMSSGSGRYTHTSSGGGRHK